MPMSRFPLILTLLLACGCNDRNYQVADPVVGPAPPRVADTSVRGQADQEPEEADNHLQTVKYEFEEERPIPLTAVVARVNGRPILAGEVLERYLLKLEQIRPQVSDAQFRQAQETVIRRDLPHLIEQKLMVDAVKAKLKKEQLEAVEQQLDEFFHMQVQEMKKQFQVDSLVALEAKMQQQGLSLETERRLFGEQQLAAEYVKAKMGEESPLTRQELIAAYKSRLDEFAEPARVKWQQLQISTTGRGGKAKGREAMNQAMAELDAGGDFSEVVKKYSNGPLAANGGHWDWTQPASIANRQVRQALEELEEGDVSGVIESDSFLQVVKVTGKRPARHKPFNEVQEKLRKEILQERQQETAERIIEELKSNAIIETMFDDEPA
jgi:peptidyl-prolyl cis-trans isomerase SurA